MKEVENLIPKLKKFEGVKCVYLFGSYATGKELPFSDIDICIIGRLGEREKSGIEALSSEKVQIVFFLMNCQFTKFNVLKEGKQLF